MIANNRFDEQNHLAVGVSTHSVKGVVRTCLPLETGKIGLEMPLQLRQNFRIPECFPENPSAALHALFVLIYGIRLHVVCKACWAWALFLLATEDLSLIHI